MSVVSWGAFTMWIKICGNTNPEDALFAAECGADALGFVFAESPRRVTVEQVREITPHLPEHVETYGVFVDADFDTVVSTVLECGLTGVQLHTLSDANLPSRLRHYFSGGLGGGLGGGQFRLLRALNYSADLDSQLKAMHGCAEIDGVLVDSRTAKAVGGTGTSFDWAGARDAFARNAPYLNMVVAGGLTPENVGDAIKVLEPWGVDIVTGVESAPGKKDAARVKFFIENARAGDRPGHTGMATRGHKKELI
ncbi:MAG TPA: phosphoribosylanthranilate isomerase [Acidisarcina sp.]